MRLPSFVYFFVVPLQKNEHLHGKKTLLYDRGS